MSLLDLLQLDLLTTKNMDIFKLLITELDSEIKITQKMLALVPADKLDWAPHEKSMKMKALTEHIADLPRWITLAFTTEELDFQNNNYVEPQANNAAELLAILDKNYLEAKSHLEKGNEDILNNTWVLRSGDQVFLSCSKYELIRTSFSQIIHHRAQLGVYFRLLNIPLPQSYGPTADDTSF